MAMYYYARKLQMKSPCSCSCCKNARAASKRGGGYSSVEGPPPQPPPPPPLPQLPPLPPLTSYSVRLSNGGVPSSVRREFSSETFPRKLPPCCANLSRSSSAYDNFGEELKTLRTRHEDEGGGEDFGMNSCEIHSGGPSPSLSLLRGTPSSFVRQRRVSAESGGSYSGGRRWGQQSVEVQVPENRRREEEGGIKTRASSGEMGDKEERKKGSLGFKGSQLISGRWETLVELAIPTESHFPETEFLFAFLLCSRLHHPPHQTLAAFFTRFSTPTRHSHRTQHEDAPPHNAGGGDGEEEAGGESRLSWSSSSNGTNGSDGETELSLNEDEFPLLIKLVGFWAQRLPHDFRDDRMMQFIRIISRRVSSANNDDDDNDEYANVPSQVREEVSSILAHLSDKLSALESYDGSLLRLRTEALIGEPIAAPSVVTICPNVEKMAEQLTLVELERFGYIGPEELVAQLVRKDRVRRGRGRESQGGEGGSDSNKSTTYLDAFIAWFKRLSMFVASEICKMSEKKSRVRVIDYWIKVAKECFKIRNFNSLMAILTGLIGAPVARLKKTWAKICCAELVELQTAMDPQSNFSAYRIMYKTAISSSSCVPQKESHNYKIIVPYFALLLRDLYNVNSTYPSSLPNGHINLAKYKELAEITKEIISWKFVRCQFVKIQHVFNSVQALPIFTENELMCASYQCEEPHSLNEKEHYVKLRRGK